MLGFSQLSDGGLWVGFGWDKKLSKKITLNGEGQLRMNQNMTRYATLLKDVGVRYKLQKDLDLDVTYRFAHGQNSRALYFFRHRLNADLRYTLDLGKPELKFRVRVQTGHRGVPGTEFNLRESGSGLRYRVGIKRKIIKKTRGLVDVEFFQSRENQSFQWSDYRIRFRVDRNLPGPHTVSVGYLYQEEIFTADPMREHILTLAYGVKF